MYRSYQDALRATEGGRSYDGGDRGRKVANHTYVYNRRDHVALRFHRTDIARFYPDLVELSSDIDTKTTLERVDEFTPLRVASIYDATTRKYRTSHRVIVAEGAPIPLDYRAGIRVTYDGKWIPCLNSLDKIQLVLPQAGMRSHVNRRIKDLRDLVKPHVALLWDAPRERKPNPPVGSIRGIIEDFLEGIELDNDDIDHVVDYVLCRNRIYKNPSEALRQIIRPQDFLFRYEKFGEAPIDQAKEILATRGPEWPQA